VQGDPILILYISSHSGTASTPMACWRAATRQPRRRPPVGCWSRWTTTSFSGRVHRAHPGASAATPAASFRRVEALLFRPDTVIRAVGSGRQTGCTLWW